MSNQQQTNPPGFDMANALSSDDIVWPFSMLPEGGSSTWGNMIVEDRKASMSAPRDMNNTAVGYGIAVSRARRIIMTALNGNLDQGIYQVY